MKTSAVSKERSVERPKLTGKNPVNFHNSQKERTWSGIAAKKAPKTSPPMSNLMSNRLQPSQAPSSYW